MHKVMQTLIGVDYKPFVKRAVLTDGTEVFVAYYPGFDGLLTQEATAEEAVAEWLELLPERIEEMDNAQLALPEPNYFVYSLQLNGEAEGTPSQADNGRVNQETVGQEAGDYLFSA